MRSLWVTSELVLFNPPVDLPSLVKKLPGLPLYPRLDGFRHALDLLRAGLRTSGVIFNGAEMGATHGAEVGDLVGLVGQGLVMVGASRVGIQGAVQPVLHEASEISGYAIAEGRMKRL